MARARTWLAAVALAVFAVGISVALLEAPAFTRLLSAQFSLAEEAGLPLERMQQVAEQVRAFVVAGRGTLPATVEGRPGFDAGAVSHLADVQRVMAGARIATALSALVVAVWLGFAVVRRRTAEIATALLGAAAICAGAVVVALVVSLVSFDVLFTWFHGVFFAQGTWTFPYDSLLIRLFPEPFWAVAGAAWAGLVLVLAALFGVSGALLRRASRHVQA